MTKWWAVRVKVHPAFFMLLAVFGWFYPAEMLMVICSLLTHEGCHGAAALYYGVKIARLELLPCGGKLVLEQTERLSRCQILAVALAGPLGSLALACFFEESNDVLYQTNRMLCWFNLLPLLPLDGGHVLRVFLRSFWDSRKASLCLTLLSAAGSLILGTVALYEYVMRQDIEISLLMMAFFIAGEARCEYRQIKYQSQRNHWRKLFRLADSGYCSGHVYLAARETKLLTVLKHSDSAGSGVVFVVNDTYRVIRIFSELELWQELERGGSQLRFCDLIK